ncbi:MAG: hypothetical protein AB7H90_01175 [Alphaproteobacteria bacterium]
MSRSKNRRRLPGRKSNAEAKSRQPTRQGRAEPEIDPVVDIARNLRQAVTGRADLPNTPLGALYGRGVVNAEGYAAGLYLLSLIELWRRGTGLNQASCEALYHRLVAGSIDADARSAAGRHLSDDVDRPTTADAAQDEIARYKAALERHQRALVHDIVTGAWPRSLVAACASNAVFWPPTETTPLVLIGGRIRQRDLHALQEISEDFRRLAALDPVPRLKKASLAA